jgi:hypothetical protein
MRRESVSSRTGNDCARLEASPLQACYISFSKAFKGSLGSWTPNLHHLVSGTKERRVCRVRKTLFWFGYSEQNPQGFHQDRGDDNILYTYITIPLSQRRINSRTHERTNKQANTHTHTNTHKHKITTFMCFPTVSV